MASAALQAAYAACDAAVRRDDPDRWLATLFMPETVRPHVHALLAFNGEVAHVRDAVTEPMLGEIRLQWWHDLIESAAAPNHPVAAALVDTITVRRLDTAPLLALIEARRSDLYDDPMPSVAALEDYLRDTGATLAGLTAQIVSPGFPAGPASEAAGRAYALTGLIRALPWQVAAGRILIPADILARFQLPSGAVLARRMSPALALVLNDLAARVRNHLDAMRRHLPDSPAPEACLPAALCEPYLAALRQPRFDIFADPIDLPRWRKLWLFWRSSRKM